MNQDERFFHNLERLATTNAKLAIQLEYFSPSGNYTLCTTEKGELNLSLPRDNTLLFLHDPKGARAEAEQWVAECDLKKQELVYVCGAGLGYFYQALQSRLASNPHAHLIFLENDLEILFHLLHTEMGTAMVENPQVRILYFKNLDEIQNALDHYFWSFFSPSIRVLLTPFTKKAHFFWAYAASYMLYNFHSRRFGVVSEFLSPLQPFYKNFYHNILDLPSMYQSVGLRNRFQNIPAIICGAGPSIEKQLPLLRSIKERALIFAGGSSLNVLNAGGVMPHFGGGVDPNPEQYHRLLMNDSFALPFFFHVRMEERAARCIYGPKLYVKSSPVHRIPRWFEEELGLFEGEIGGGFNVGNLCMEMAQHMGCHPIILVGVDLSYPHETTYAKGVGTHPLWLGESQPYEIPHGIEVTWRRDIHGNPVMTTWPWIAEGEYVSFLAATSPDTRWINATEGGIGFEGIPNQSLQEVAEKYLTQTYDLEGWIHCVIQESTMPPDVTTPALVRLFGKLEASLERCQRLCHKIERELLQSLQKLQEGKRIPTTVLPGKAVLAEAELLEELAYQQILIDYNETYQLYQKKHREQRRILREKEDTIEKILQEKEWLFERLQFLEQIIAFNRAWIQAEAKKVLFSFEKEPITLPHRAGDGSSNDFYAFPENQVTFSDRDGHILSKTSWKEGRRSGTCHYFYASGSLYCRKEYSEGEPTGTHEYFYPNGTKKAEIPYAQGLLHGSVRLFTANGGLFREIAYEKGKRQGTETLFNEREQKIFCVEWREGVAVGTAREWYESGEMRREIHIEGNTYRVDLYDKRGKKIKTTTEKGEDYSALFAEVETQTKEIQRAVDLVLKNVFDTLSDPEREMSLKERKERLQELHAIEDEVLHLKKLHEELKIQEKKIQDDRRENPPQ